MKSRQRHMLELLVRSTCRYARLLPDGLQLEDGGPVHPVLEVELVSHGDARTLYRGRRPVCRSLDGATSVTDIKRQCDPCYDRKHCTPQVRIEFTYQRQPYRLLLAHTSARNFILYLTQLSKRKTAPRQASVRMVVRNRSTWGELHFTPPVASADDNAM